MNKLKAWTGLYLSLALVIPLNASAMFLTDINRSYEASGGSAPAQGTSGSVVFDGDFRVRNWANNVGPVYDGKDDETNWVFHFAENNAERSAFLRLEDDLRSTKGRLVEANVYLELTPMHSLISTDEFQLVGLAPINQHVTSAFSELTVGTMQTVHLNLFDFYDEDELSNYILDRRGIFGASFRDDAILHVAKMDLRSVSEPTSLFLLSTGLLGLWSTRRKQYT
jgi:hypothetical protein